MPKQPKENVRNRKRSQPPFLNLYSILWWNKKQELVHNARIYNGEKREIKLGVEEDFYISIPRRQKKNIKKSFVIDQNIAAPISKNTALGFMVIKLDGKVVSRAKLIALEDIKEGNLYRRTVDSILQVF